MILGISGRKQAGKDTAANFIQGITLVEQGVIDSFEINSQGELWVSNIFDIPESSGIFKTDNLDESDIEFFNKEVWPYVKLYSFADPLKKICTDILGIEREKIYGTNEQKEQLTHIKWPQYTGLKGNMTGREVMEYVGTGVFRKLYEDCWANGTISQIRKDKSARPVIKDVRGPNEVYKIQEAGGRVIRLTRNPFDAQTEIESALDRDNFDWDDFDYVIDNKDMSISQQNEAIYKLLSSWGYFTKNIV